MAVNILPRCFHVVLIVGRQIQFVQCVGIVVRRKQAGILHPHLSLEPLAFLSLDFEAIGVNAVQPEQLILDRK